MHRLSEHKAEANKIIDRLVQEFKTNNEHNIENISLPSVEVDLDVFGKGELVNGKISGLRSVRRVGDCESIEIKHDEAILKVNFCVDNVQVDFNSNIDYFGKRHPVFKFSADQVLFQASISIDKLTGELLFDRCTGTLTKIKGFRIKIKSFGFLLTPFVNLIARLTRTEIKRLVELYIQNSLEGGLD